MTDPAPATVGARSCWTERVYTSKAPVASFVDCLRVECRW